MYYRLLTYIDFIAIFFFLLIIHTYEILKFYILTEHLKLLAKSSSIDLYVYYGRKSYTDWHKALDKEGKNAAEEAKSLIDYLKTTRITGLVLKNIDVVVSILLLLLFFFLKSIITVVSMIYFNTVYISTYHRLSIFYKHKIYFNVRVM